ncbi:Hsp20/alpha crystallin family protein [Pedomonas sp. V897]|uniref:Hsp20/alpha crystallin family protein n=1 Tax=Pedomonas sp. V897 TaxID=3446482 RepID=UPI003EDF15E8
MAMRDLTPRNRGGLSGGGLSGGGFGPGDWQSPMLNLRRDIESMFEDMFRGGFAPLARMGGASLPGLAGMAGSAAWPSIEVSETDSEIRITAEVPGLSENDVELMIEEGVLTIRGEKKTETEDRERGYSERYYGHFERRIGLPAGVDEENAQADFHNGVLRITLRKTQEGQRARRIPIGARGEAGRQPGRAQERPAMQQAAAGPAKRQHPQQHPQQQAQQGEPSAYEPPRQPQE